MKRVVFLKSRAQFKGGLEKYTHVLMQAFVKKGCHVTLLTTGEAPPSEAVESISLARDSKFSLLQLVRFDALCKKWVRTNPQDIVFGMERTTSQTHYRAGNGVHAVFLKQRTLIDSWLKQLTFAINPLHRGLLAMEKKAFEAPELKCLFTNSSMVREEILNTYSTPAEKIVVVHNGVEWKEWEGVFEQSLQQPRMGSYRLLFVGNGYQRKGLPFLLRGLHKLKSEDFFLTVIGKEKKPAAFIQAATQLGLKEKVEFLGPQKNLQRFYSQADALVLPSIYDPFANVTVEALAMGLYVVTSPFNGGKEVLKEFSGSVIEELTSPESVAASLQRAFSHPKTEARARQIRESIKQLDFSNQLDKIVQRTLED